MAAVIRQPFAPLDGARLQSLTSIKNVQSSIPVSSPGKRKATDVLDVNDFENLDPAFLLSKRAKSSADGLSKDYFKPSSFYLTKSSSAPTVTTTTTTTSSSSSKDGLSYGNFKAAASPRARPILNPKSPAKKLHSSLSKTVTSPSMSAPAGRSPTRGTKRVGILNRHRAGRIDPPSFNLFSSTTLSLAAAVKGTLPSYASRQPSSSSSKASIASESDSVYGSSMKSSWFFDIHEDTPEQVATNLLQHSTCMLDISSDEECEQKMQREKAEGRGKENIPPADDVSQTSIRRAAATTISEGGMEYEKPRIALGDLNVEDFYADGVDPSEVIIVPGDEDDGTLVDGEQPQEPAGELSDLPASDCAPDVTVKVHTEAEESSEPTTPGKAAALPPLDGAGENFDLWESSSAKEEGDVSRLKD
ncbi:hypothetical protein M406DRAFT_344482 [Cryphonectria parasitica EP155]|uniref:Thymidylate kinase n=1 Tax=Cryphonectria parasitica (strain ATCC 38755 / EP155) TaxID=660469 RepID=A0A9P4YDN2_CRYP1|nr:uncharacterized protein M406DRAFT_344482 [Cryphonectria parasitica EP155]KAF3771101.1 hypothetical protein M406DRAFT_344482 [Cryphonectria parasitica EP155]